MTRKRSILVVVAVIAGCVLGAIVAIAIPRTEKASAPKSAAPVQPTRVQPARAQSTAPGDLQLRPDLRTVRIEAQTPDPEGGPSWALRIFKAVRFSRQDGKDRIASKGRCVQLGRFYRGQFGWMDASSTFRPVSLGMAGAPIKCGSRTADMRGEPIVAFENLVTNPRRPNPRVYRTALWGIAGSAAEAGTARLGDRRLPLSLSASGGFLVLGSADEHDSQSRVGLRYATRRLTVAPESVRRPSGPGTGVGAVNPVGPTHIAARAPDPGGGLSWGIAAARSSRGGWCVTAAGRVFGDRIGSLDPRLGTIREGSVGTFDCRRVPLSRHFPLNFQMGSGSEISDDVSRSRSGARRALSGRTIVSGTTMPGVKFVTVTTPRDVRTVEPTSQTHAIILVYDGTFPTGEIVMTTTFDDGTTHTDKVPVAPF